ncbi:bleomycin resistance protein, partial [Thalassolituus oleivorans]|uniref:bleomycin resistance protein n=2 Tax=Pseudomonadota TaxID=1224 RepID=UPI001CE24309
EIGFSTGSLCPNGGEAMKLGKGIPQLPSGNIEATAEFFQIKLGFNVEAIFPDHGHLILTRDDAEIHFWSAENEAHARTIGSDSSCYIRVENVSELYEELKEREAPFRYELTEQPWGMVEMQIDDPYGNAIRFGEPVVK